MTIKELREQVYEANMELERRKLIIFTWGNVSQIDREKGIFAIKPSGVPYDKLTPDMICILDAEDGHKVEGNLNPSSDTPTHLELYKAFPDVGGVTHTHSPFATAWAQAGHEIPCFGTTHADYFHGEIPVSRYLTEEEIEEGYEKNTGKVIIEAFEGKKPLHTPGILVRGHGPFTWGKDGMDSVHNAVYMEEIAKIAQYMYAIRPDFTPIPERVSEKHFLRKHGPNAYYGQK